MPHINTEVDVDVDIEVEDFLDECSPREIKKVIKYLRDNQGILIESGLSAPESEFENALDKLHGKWNRLSKEDEQLIIAISNKF